MPTAFFVLAWQRLKENKPTKQQQLPKTGIEFIENLGKLTPGGVPEALGGGLGTILAPGGDPGCPRDARSRKSDEKFVISPFVPHFSGPPKSHIFGIFSISVVFLGDVFRKRFWKASGHHF